MKRANNFHYERGYKRGCADAGFYWTSLITIALHNLYGWKNNFEKIEEEVARLHKELKSYKSDNLIGEKLLYELQKVRGPKYMKDLFGGEKHGR